MDIEELAKKKKELASRREPLLMIQEMMAEVSGDTRLQLKCKLDRFVDRVANDIIDSEEINGEEFMPVLNIFNQMIECYEDILKKKLMSMSNRDIHEIEGIRGMYNVIPLYVIREFKWNSNFMYCLDYKSGKIICERKFSDYENIRKDKRTYRIKRGKKQIQRNSKKTINSFRKDY